MYRVLSTGHDDPLMTHSAKIETQSTHPYRRSKLRQLHQNFNSRRRTANLKRTNKKTFMVVFQRRLAKFTLYQHRRLFFPNMFPQTFTLRSTKMSSPIYDGQTMAAATLSLLQGIRSACLLRKVSSQKPQFFSASLSFVH